MIRLLLLVTSNLCGIVATVDLCQNRSQGGSEEYLSLRSATTKSSLLTNPCDTDRSIWTRDGYFYQFNREELQWKQLCILAEVFHHQVIDPRIPVVNSIAHRKEQLVMIINGTMYRTEDIRRSLAKIHLLSRLTRYSNVPLLGDRLHHLFTSPCCVCNEADTQRSTSGLFNEEVLLADQDGHLILFSFESLTIVYDFGRIFQSQPACQVDACKILYLGLSHSSPTLMCIVQVQMNRALIFHRSFFSSNITLRQTAELNITGEHLSVTPSTFPDAYFLWDEARLFYTLSNGLLLSEIQLSGCDEESFDQLNDGSTKHGYTRFRVDDGPASRNASYCVNRTLDYLFVSPNEFFLMTKTGECFYGQESFVPSMIYIEQQHNCGPLVNTPHRFGWLQGTGVPWRSDTNLSQCLWSIEQQSVPCSAYTQSNCPYTRFHSLFDRQRLYRLEKNTKQAFAFVLHASRLIPMMIIRSPSDWLNYSVSYTRTRLKNRTIEIHAEILASPIDHLYQSGVVSFRVGTVQHSYACPQAPSLWKQRVHYSALYGSRSTGVKVTLTDRWVRVIRRVHGFDSWNESNSVIDIDWLRQHLPANALDHFSSFYIQHKQTDPILLNYQYCFNQSCASVKDNELGPVLIYAIAVEAEHEDYARHLIARTDSCLPISRTVDQIWRGLIKNMTHRAQLTPISSDRRTFYDTLLRILGLNNGSCLFFDPSEPIQINRSINQASQDHLKFILHIINLRNQFSYCELETFVIIDIETVHPSFHPNRGVIFFVALFLFILLSALLIRLYTYYKSRESRKHFHYHCLNQLDAGQLHQWYDLARFLNDRDRNELHD